MLKLVILAIIRWYQRTLSPDTGWFSYKHPYGHCRFYPHCSSYSYQAIEKYGLLKGIFLASKRILKCHPFHQGGHDPLL